jgi:hypothetical protein
LAQSNLNTREKRIVHGRRNIAFDLYKGETDFLSVEATKALFETYFVDDMVFACASDFRTEPFRSLTEPRKLAAIANAANAAIELHGKSNNCLKLLNIERAKTDRKGSARKFFRITN